MSKQSIKATIDANIKQNGAQAITGQIMNSVLNQMVDNLAEEASTTEKLTELDSEVNGKPNYTDGFYLDSTGNQVVSSDYCVSEYIAIDSASLAGGVMWTYGVYKANACLILYNNSKGIIDFYGALNSATQRKLSQSQLANASFVRISFAKETGGKLEDVNNWGILYQSGKTDGVDYLHSQIVSLLGKDGARVSAATLSDGQTLSVNDFARSIQAENKISMTAAITSWGGGIVVGKGTTDWGASYVTIDDTNVVVNVYQGGSTITKYRKAHGLTFAQLVKVVLSQSSNNLSIKIITLNGYFEDNISDFEYKFNGFPRITSVGASLRNVSLSASNPSYQYPIWMFGDSYFGADTDNREMYWLREQWGFDKFMLNGFAGRASEEALNEFSRCLKFGCPKYLVWCLGMNDDILEDYKYAISELKELCEQNDITLILQTIPSVPVRNKVAMNQYIKSLGLRYIDVNAAVGAGDTGNWWGTGTEYDYLSSDGVHPSVYGARAIAAQFLADMPEIMQYV